MSVIAPACNLPKCDSSMLRAIVRPLDEDNKQRRAPVGGGIPGVGPSGLIWMYEHHGLKKVGIGPKVLYCCDHGILKKDTFITGISKI